MPTSPTAETPTSQTQVTLGSKVIAITGANRGIGLGIAECCLSNGAAKVYSIDIGETGEEFDTLSERYPGQLYALKANVSEEATITAAVDQIITEAGALHALEWAQYGIRVNSVSPGLVNTAMTYWVPQQPDWEQQLKYYGGFPRLAEVQELGGAYVYLLSDAASYTTSIDIPVNGVIGIC
ncbi:hypothetical protein BBP40_001392 [Aspergillus hancockii]|nr:hypothetical protein BBP40_001392 [Aspergillus hancockii]